EKITMPSQRPQLSRPRLLELLQSSLDSRSCTVICGRVGSGKTVLATDLAQGCNRPVSWYKVDTADAELSIFFGYLAASIKKQWPRFKDRIITTRAAIVSAENIHQLAEEFVFELLQHDGRELLMVIEDLHLICDTEWLVPFLWRFLPLVPRDVHVLITS